MFLSPCRVNDVTSIYEGKAVIRHVNFNISSTFSSTISKFVKHELDWFTKNPFGLNVSIKMRNVDHMHSIFWLKVGIPASAFEYFVICRRNQYPDGTVITCLLFAQSGCRIGLSRGPRRFLRDHRSKSELCGVFRTR